MPSLQQMAAGKARIRNAPNVRSIPGAWAYPHFTEFRIAVARGQNNAWTATPRARRFDRPFTRGLYGTPSRTSTRLITNLPPRFPHPTQNNATPTTADRRVAKAEMLRREMDWSSDDALTPAPKTYARDFYYDDSDGESPVNARKPVPASIRGGVSVRRTGRDNAGLNRGEANASNASARNASSTATTSSHPGAALCAEGDKTFLGFDVPKSKQQAFELYLKAANQHEYAPALLRLGNCFLLDDGGGHDGPDLDQAIIYFQKGASAGNNQCLVALGECYEKQGDLTLAFQTFTKALQNAGGPSDTSHRDANLNIARFKEFGLGGVPVDVSAARSAYEQCAKQGSSIAQRSIGILTLRDAEMTLDEGEKARLTEAASDYLHKAAKQGDAEAMNQLGILYEDGLIRIDANDNTDSALDKARSLYARAAHLGHDRAMNNLGFACAAAGAHQEAAKCFKKAVLDGDVDAAHNLGNFYETGVGVDKDLNEAKRLYAEAAAGGHEQALQAATRLAAGETTKVFGSDDPNTSAASLRRQLQSKENETARLALDLGESKAETARLKGKVKDLKLEMQGLVKSVEAAKKRETEFGTSSRGSPAGGFSGTFGTLGNATGTHSAAPGVTGPSTSTSAPPVPLLKPEFTRSTSLMSNRSTHSNYSAYSGLSGVSKDDDEGKTVPVQTTNVSQANSGTSTQSTGPGAAKRSRGLSDASRLAATKRLNEKSKSKSKIGSVFGMSMFGAAKGTDGNANGSANLSNGEADKELAKAHARELNSLKHELEQLGFKAEVHEEMATTLSTLLKSTYARNLQLEELLKSVGLDADDPAVAKDLHPIRVEEIAGVSLGKAGSFRETPGERDEGGADGLALPAPR